MSNCASYKAQYKEKELTFKETTNKSDIEHSFYLVGDGGNSPIGSETATLKLLKTKLAKASKNSTLLFLGDNIYPAGMPKEEKKSRAFAEHQLNIQTAVAKDFKGNTIFIPGNHDWYSNGLKGLKRQEDYIKNILGKNSFLPKNGCPIEKEKISENIVLILIDTEWFLTDWDKHPTLNDDCDIKTREAFFEAYEGMIKKARGKTVIVAMHHPMFTNGPHGGQFSLKQQLYPIGGSIPLPVIGTFLNLIRKTSGVSNTDLQHKRYTALKKRMVTLSQENEQVIFVSGHEHSLQYLKQDNLPQIISGSGSKTSATRNTGAGLFSYGEEGYARLDILVDGSANVTFVASKKDQIVYQTKVLEPLIKPISTYPKNTDPMTTASVYSKEEVTKGGFYKFLWGERFRKYYGTKITVNNVKLDTLFGGLTPIRKGGGHQSKSLRLEDAQGREYVMRALKKNAVQYLQAVAFKDQFIAGQFDATYPEALLLDIFTGSHPYAPFAIAELAEAINVLHTKPLLVYVPKQTALKEFNLEFGDALYMIEERVSSGHGEKANFDHSNTVISTLDLLKELRKNEKSTIDERAYIRARLFDMLIGDWDRHEDQWRWAAFEKNNKTVYKAFPRDRDQAFSKMADGALLNYLTKSVPALRLMQSFDTDIKNVKWFNLEAYPLDKALINQATNTDWIEEARFIQENITENRIEKAFSKLPAEVQGQDLELLKKQLKIRLQNLQKIATSYAEYLSAYAIVTGTDKDDLFEIERLTNGDTKIAIYRIEKGKKGTLIHSKQYAKNDTKEIWVYGLDDEDVFRVFGKGTQAIELIIIGGQNNDQYHVENKKKLDIYDYKSKKNTFVGKNLPVHLSDTYETNVYNYNKIKSTQNEVYPNASFNPDDGISLGLLYSFTQNGFKRNPFSSYYEVSAASYLLTGGYELGFAMEFANHVSSWNIGVEGVITSPNYSVNFFGYGNETTNPNFIDEDQFEEDFNRVRIRMLKLQPYFNWRGALGANFKLGLSFENYQVEKTPNRAIEDFYNNNQRDYRQSFVGLKANYHYKNQDNNAFPTLGMEIDLTAGFTSNINNSNQFAYLIPALSFDYKLNASGLLVLATKMKAHLNFSNGYEFYQAATIGGEDGVRGYRNQRFTGKNSWIQNTDIRLSMYQVKTSLIPLHLGLFTGIDYGKVWLDTENSSAWRSSFGGGIFVNGAQMISANIGVFKGTESARVLFSMGFRF
ncbi:hypothetical protein GCM10011416_04490 [Polaribacter pacificus]|uniref:Calcineurin-like phosphoesterase n=1 Tax=Polaribacter pacificus TaxID=1775173 RepID=A0A917MBZ5_9FLAO|nr:hypothetical protein GCM10011416_04490 [Polaribacter pacificus]